MAVLGSWQPHVCSLIVFAEFMEGEADGNHLCRRMFVS